ncbi:conserved hypothetical protein [Planktothrix agardhii]|uniref:glycosyltransferase family 4 protein n=1 Tax=Planktothrix agardhii TaxID=1160 RepID=UPI001B907AD2|nr:glycosyltransferase family 4 protein [Planktothrix agardhii]CAD0231735.1 conserved hypothetical protein [Planktothrix agardhii]
MLTENFGINVAAHINGDFGLAEAARSSLKAMQAVDIPFAINNLPIHTSPQTDTTFTDFSIDNPYPINLVHTNPNWVYNGIYEKVFNNFGMEYFKNRYNIGFWFWELPQFPSEWEFAFDFFDEIWTASRYTLESIATASPIPIIKIPLCIDISQPSLTRKDLRLPEDKFIFMLIFDFGSSFERKNCLATVQAFQQSFGCADHEACLVIKFSNAEHFPQQREQLKALTEGWSSIQFIEGHLKKEEIHGLIYNCDCYISLHRAEGFGLTLAEAMFYGKPVIATAYSSNLDFMNIGNSFLVDYKLIATTEEHGFYPKGSIWAEPDVDHAASFMRYVFENYPVAQEIGIRASNEIKSMLSPQAVGATIQRRLEYIKKMMGNSSQFSRNYQIQKLELQKECWISQTNAWRQTAQQIQRELKETQSQRH